LVETVITFQEILLMIMSSK